MYIYLIRLFYTTQSVKGFFKKIQFKKILAALLCLLIHDE